MSTHSNPGLIELTNTDGKPPVFENFTKDAQLTIDKTGLTLTVQSYNWGTARATVKVNRGRWYYEVKIGQSGQARIGWATYNYAPENRYDGVGSDSDSYGWDGSRKTCHHDDKKSGNSNGVAYGDYWSKYVLSSCFYLPFAVVILLVAFWISTTQSFPTPKMENRWVLLLRTSKQSIR